MPDQTALRDVAPLRPVYAVEVADAFAVLRVLTVGYVDLVVVDDRRRDQFIARLGPDGIFRVAVEFPELLSRQRFIASYPAIALSHDYLINSANFADCGRAPLTVQYALAYGVVFPHQLARLFVDGD